MKYFTALLLAFTALFGSNQLAASDLTKQLTYSWSGNEEDLYLDITLSKELEFADSYTIFNTKNGQGQGCRIVCKPMQGITISSSEGYELQEIRFTVILNNVSNPNRVAYTTITSGSYEGINEKGLLVTTTSESKREGLLNNPAIDLSEEPSFFTISDELHEGVIFFKNSFPYSQMQ